MGAAAVPGLQAHLGVGEPSSHAVEPLFLGGRNKRTHADSALEILREYCVPILKQNVSSFPPLVSFSDPDRWGKETSGGKDSCFKY